ncbi:hypothetical protein [Nocardioides sp. Root151]|uniref:hypothetical protein n=1 Tax=Nocardioides sp. Root151 TaxID=1736475 RepID=UPI000B26B831|nr:hypothetical protein [Nocardioides sp. Root151]
MPILLGIVLALCCLSACSNDGSDGSDGPPATEGSGVTGLFVEGHVERAWTTRLRAIGQPVVVGRTAVVLTRAPRHRLAIVGLDTDNGRRLWRHPFQPSNIATGYYTRPFVGTSKSGHRFVVFQRPDDVARSDQWAEPLVAVAPRSGRVVHSTEPVDVTDAVDTCLDGEDMCVAIVRDGGSERVRFRLDKGGLRPAHDGVTIGARMLADGGLYSSGGTPESFGRAHAGKVQWVRRLAGTFGAAHTSDQGWSLAYDEKAGVFWGSVGRTYTSDDIDSLWRNRRPLSPSDTGVVGFDAATGEVLWRRKTADNYCGTQADDDLPVRCFHLMRFTKYVPGQSISGKVRRLRMEGFDVKTGRTTWSVSVRGKAAENANAQKGRVAGRITNLHLKQGWRIVFLTDGRTRAAEPGEVFLCAGKVTTYAYHLDDDASGVRRTGDNLRSTCTVRGKRVSGVPSVSALTSGAAEKAPGATWLVATARGVTAYRITQ